MSFVKRAYCIILIMMLIPMLLAESPRTASIRISSYLRSTPLIPSSPKSNVIKIVKANQPCSLVKFNKGWFLCRFEDGSEGWVYRKLLNYYDSQNQPIENFDPYKDSEWHPTKTPQPIKQTTHQVKEVDTSTHVTTKTQEKPKKPVSSKPAQTQPAQQTQVVATQSPEALTKEIAFSDSLIRINERIDSINNTIALMQNNLDQKSSQLSEVLERINQIEVNYTNINKKVDSFTPSTSNTLLWILMAILIILVFILYTSLSKTRRILGARQEESQTTIENLETKIKNSYKKMTILSRNEYQEIKSALSYLSHMEDRSIQALLNETESNKGNVKKMSNETLSYLKSKDISQRLREILSIYTVNENTEARQKKALKLIQDMETVVAEVITNLNSSEPFSRTVENWFKNLATTAEGITNLTNIFRSNLLKNYYQSFFQATSETYPSETSNIQQQIQNKNWRQALHLFEKSFNDNSTVK